MASSSLADRFRLSEFLYAHRGLWCLGGPHEDRPHEDNLPENSLSAFKAAERAGVGVELDVRPSRDGVPVIFHDADLMRLTGRIGKVSDLSWNELRGLPLQASDDTIPCLEDVLQAWSGVAPLLCELKIDGETDPKAFAEQVGRQLLSFDGSVAAMSFSETAVANLPEELQRGQLIPPSAEIGRSAFEARVERALQSDVDYLACHHNDVTDVTGLMKERPLPLTAWTVTEPDEAETLLQAGTAIIFEGFDPGLVKRA